MPQFLQKESVIPMFVNNTRFIAYTVEALPRLNSIQWEHAPLNTSAIVFALCLYNLTHNSNSAAKCRFAFKFLHTVMYNDGQC